MNQTYFKVISGLYEKKTMQPFLLLGVLLLPGAAVKTFSRSKCDSVGMLCQKGAKTEIDTYCMTRKPEGKKDLTAGFSYSKAPSVN